MTDTSFDVRIYKTDVYKGAKTTTYWVRWAVARKPFKEPFRTSALAESFRSKLNTAAREGEAFDRETGLTVVDDAEHEDVDVVRVRVRLRGHEVARLITWTAPDDRRRIDAHHLGIADHDTW